VSHFPGFDQLEQVLLNWPRLFDAAPTGTQPMAVQGETVIVLCADGDWISYITQNQHILVEGLRELVAGDLRSQLRRIVPAPATPTEIFLARQLVVVQAKLRDVELGF
jgi:predicted nucleic acid-binding Zn ribbon protein